MKELKTAELAIDDSRRECLVTINGRSYSKLSSLSFCIKPAFMSIEIVHNDYSLLEDTKEIFTTTYQPAKINLNIKQLEKEVRYTNGKCGDLEVLFKQVIEARQESCKKVALFSYKILGKLDAIEDGWFETAIKEFIYYDN